MKSKPKLKSKSKSKSKSEPKPKSNPIAIEAESPSEFAFAVARTAVSQICQSVGFKSAQLSALHTLTAVAAAYLQAAAKSSTSLAAAANRTDSNLLDLAAALHDLRSGAALSAAPAAAAEADRCPLRSSALADIAAFVRSTPETPFAKPVPRRRRRRHRRPNSAPDGIGSDNGPIPRPPHVPHWLPEAPETAVAKGERGGGGGGGEELWEDRVGRGGIGVVVVGEEGGEREGKLEERGERESVRFKVGVGLRSGVSKGGKIRVCWDNHNRIRNGLNNNGGCLGVVETDYMVKHAYDGSS